MAEIQIGENVLLVSADTNDAQNIGGVIDRWKPDVVALEFCEKREEVVFDSVEFGKKSLLDVMRDGAFYSLLGQLLYHSVYTEIERERSYFINSTLAAKEEAEKRGLEVEYIDQGIDILVKRAWRQVPGKEKWELVKFYRRSLMKTDVKEAEDISDDNVIGIMINNLLDAAPSSKNALVEERKEHLALSILESAKEKKVLAVVAEDLFHDIKDRVKEGTPDPERKAELETYQKKFKASNYRWILAGVLVSFFIYTLVNSGFEEMKTIMIWWSIATMLSSAIGAIVSRAHPLSIAAAILSAPFISLTFMGAGWVAGIVELKVREPKVQDFIDLGQMSSKQSLFSNKCTKPLAVGAITNLANWMGIIIVLPLIAGIA